MAKVKVTSLIYHDGKYYYYSSIHTAYRRLRRKLIDFLYTLRRLPNYRIAKRTERAVMGIAEILLPGKPEDKAIIKRNTR